jgi:hypothetical protein
MQLCHSDGGPTTRLTSVGVSAHEPFPILMPVIINASGKCVNRAKVWIFRPFFGFRQQYGQEPGWGCLGRAEALRTLRVICHPQGVTDQPLLAARRRSQLASWRHPNPAPKMPKAIVTGSGTAVMSKPQLVIRLCSPSADRSANTNVQFPFGFMPPNVPLNVARPVPYSVAGSANGLTFRPSAE